MQLDEQLQSVLRTIPIVARRMLLETPDVSATAPMLRGVWGAALHDLDDQAYSTVFAPQIKGHGETPAMYILRPAPPDPAFSPAIEWISIGPALRFDAMLRRAWDVASGMGLGPKRERFHVHKVVPLNSDGTLGKEQSWGRDSEAATVGWSLGDAAWPLADPAASPCRLMFRAPLRLRRHGRLIDRPTLPDLIAAATRRIQSYLPKRSRDAWKQTAREALELARGTPAEPWQGERLDLHRYSGRQQAELDLHGVTGFLELPDGPGELWPLLAVAQWLHLGKGTVMGLGQLIVEGM